MDELWYVLDGLGRMWCQSADRAGVEVELRPGTALAIPVGTRFQFRNTGRSPLVAVAVTMPPWPGEAEATATHGPWVPTV
ncbi:MAG: cupin domain-containing protein [Mycobacterium leprae]